MTVNKIIWLGHGSIRIEGEKVIYIDPWKLKADPPRADIILITHSHYDHLSIEDIDKISREETVIIAPADCAGKLPAGFRKIAPGEKEIVDKVVIEAVPAYNINKQFHPRANNWVGYIIRMGGEKIYQSGDTDYIPEMDSIRADVVIVPVGGTFTMSAEEAAAAVNEMNPRLAIPVHFGDIVGSVADAEKFRKLCRVPVEILTVSS